MLYYVPQSSASALMEVANIVSLFVKSFGNASATHLSLFLHLFKAQSSPLSFGLTLTISVWIAVPIL